MCATCGCDHDANVTITKTGETQYKPVKPANLLQIPSPSHHHLPVSKEIQLERDILHKNNLRAKHNREHFRSKHIFSVNLVSSPGSGKTSLLERTLRDLKNEMQFYVIEGDQQTMNDANRIAATGVTAVQINTGKGCHLDADMVHRAIHQLEPAENSVVFIENVGNLVCPAMFDLGENDRVAVISVTEGDDKPIKYPDMFASAELCIINKIDLLPYVNFNVEKAKEYALRVNPNLKFLELSVTSGEGMFYWYRWLKAKAFFCFSTQLQKAG
ncbi:MAG: hydrogenase nickel incorporation protein HypB [Bacteroidetes bacterium]|nr:hydrogenase nickel incorporation protein HypB [Bacteroidota bacterium]